MKKFNLILTILILSSLLSIGQTWNFAGSNGIISSNSFIYYFSKSTAVGSDGTLYVGYKKNNALYVSKFTGGTWEQLGGAVSTNIIESISLAIHPGTGNVYATYADDGGGKLGIKSFYNGQWNQMGTELTGTNLFYKINTAFTSTSVLLVGGYDGFGVPFTKALSGTSWIDLDMSSFANFKGGNPISLFFDKGGKAYFAYPYWNGNMNIIKVLYFDSTWKELNTSSFPENIDGRMKALVSPDGTVHIGYLYQGSFYFKKFNTTTNDWVSVGNPIVGSQLFDIKFLTDGTPVVLHGDKVKWLKDNEWVTIGDNFTHSGIDYYLENDKNGNLYVVYQNGGNSLYNAGTIMAKTFSTSTLPVEIISFKSAINGSVVALNWSTANETNNKGYMIERSGDGNNFTSIGYLQASKGMKYTFNDNNPLDGMNYYRLIQEDLNGAKSTLGITSSQVSLNKNTFSVYPNPFHGNMLSIQVDAAKASELTNVSIIDLLGTVVLSKNAIASNGHINIPIDTNLSKGVYFIRVGSNISKLIVP